MTFQDRIARIPEIAEGYRPGLQALENDSHKIAPADTRLCEGSVDLDSHLEALYPGAMRWDYAFGYNRKVYCAEVHPASPKEVKAVIGKWRWLRNWFAAKAPSLAEASPTYHWIPSGKTSILKNSREYRRLAAKGIRLERRVMQLNGS